MAICYQGRWPADCPVCGYSVLLSKGVVTGGIMHKRCYLKSRKKFGKTGKTR